jgi:hypothetical protein
MNRRQHLLLPHPPRPKLEELVQAHLPLNVSHQKLHLVLLADRLPFNNLPLIPISLSVDQRKLEVEPVCKRGSTLGTSGVGGDDDGGSPVRDGGFDVADDDGFREEVVDGDVEKALDLGGVKVHGNDVVSAGNGDEVGDESRAKSGSGGKG